MRCNTDFVTFHVCEVQDCREAEVAVPVVMSFCVAGVALCDIPCVCEVQDCREADVAVPMGKVAQTCLFRRVGRCASVVLRGRRGTL